MSEIVLDQNVTKHIAAELRKSESVLKNCNAFRNPKNDGIYVTSSKTPVFWSENKVANATALSKFLNDMQKFGSLSDDPIYDQVEIYEGRFQSTAEDYLKWQKDAAVGGVQVPENFTAIEVTNLLSQLRNQDDLPTVMQDIGSSIPVDKIEGKIPLETGITAKVGVTRGAEIETSMTQYTTVPYTLLLIGVHVAKDSELGMGNLAFDPYKRSIKRAGQAITTSIAKLNKTNLYASAVTDTGVAWDSITSGSSTNNPWKDDIGPAADTIVAAQGNPKQLAMNDPVFRALETNTWMTGKGVGSNAASTTPQLGVAKKISLADTGLQGFVDTVNPTDEAVLLDPEGFVRFIGPDGVLTYDDVHHRLQGYYALQYYNSKIVEANKVVKITNVLA